MPASKPGNKPTTLLLPQTLAGEVASETSSNILTPDLTPSETPKSHNGLTAEKLDLKRLSSSADMDKDISEGQAPAKEEVQPSPAEGSSSTKVEVRNKDPGEVSIKKVICKKHSKPRRSMRKRRKSKKESSSSSDDSSDDTSESSEDESEEEETSSSEVSEDEVAEKKRKSKARRKAKKLKEKKKSRSNKHKESSTESSEEESSDDESSSEDENSKRARKNKKRKAKKAKKVSEIDPPKVVDVVDPVARTRAQLNALALGGRGGARRGFAGRNLVADRDAALKKVLAGKLPGKSKGGKKKKYVRQGHDLRLEAYTTLLGRPKSPLCVSISSGTAQSITTNSRRQLTTPLLMSTMLISLRFEGSLTGRISIPVSCEPLSTG